MKTILSITFILLFCVTSLDAQVKIGWSRYTFLTKHTNAQPGGVLDSVYTVKIRGNKIMTVKFTNDTVSSFTIRTTK